MPLVLTLIWFSKPSCSEQDATEVFTDSRLERFHRPILEQACASRRHGTEQGVPTCLHGQVSVILTTRVLPLPLLLFQQRVNCRSLDSSTLPGQWWPRVSMTWFVKKACRSIIGTRPKGCCAVCTMYCGRHPATEEYCGSTMQLNMRHTPSHWLTGRLLPPCQTVLATASHCVVDGRQVGHVGCMDV